MYSLSKNAHCRLSHAHRDAARYAMNNSTLLSNPQRETYLVGHISPHNNLITIEPKTEIVVKDTITQGLYGEHGAHLHTRAEIQSGNLNMGQKRLIAVGGILTLEDESGASAIPLHTRNGSFPMSGKVTQPSGLASEPPRKSIWMRMNDEFGGVFVHPDTKTIEVLILKPDAETLAAYPDLMNNMEVSKKRQERNIRKEIAKTTPEAAEADWKMKWTAVETAGDKIPGLEDEIAIAGDKIQCGKLKGIILDEPERATININLLVSVKLPGSLNKLQLLDMEGYGRVSKLYSAEEVVELGDNATPALKDFGQRFQNWMARKLAPPQIGQSDLSPSLS